MLIALALPAAVPRKTHRSKPKMASRLGQSCAKMGQSMPWIGTRQRDWPIFGWFWAERTKHFHYDEKDTVEFPDQNVVHGVQRLQIRGRRGEQSTRNRALHPNRVGDHASGGLRREPLYRWQRTTWQGFLYVRLQLCPERELQRSAGPPVRSR